LLDYSSTNAQSLTNLALFGSRAPVIYQLGRKVKGPV
jgi:hypothetical protein